MITKLNNFTLKSFVGYTNPNDLLFRVKNILFGYNGKGKSAIAIGIKDEFLKDQAKKPENLRTFDRDYISNHCCPGKIIKSYKVFCLYSSYL